MGYQQQITLDVNLEYTDAVYCVLFKRGAAVTFSSRGSDSTASPRCRRFTAASLRYAGPVNSIISLFNNPSMSVSSRCGSFNPSRVYQKN